jgi:hypothetical protein
MLSTVRQYSNVIWSLMPLSITEELEGDLSLDLRAQRGYVPALWAIVYRFIVL